MPIDPGRAPGTTAALAIVHHANQYLISDNYVNRSGIRSVAGSVSTRRGLVYILHLHHAFQIPATIHISGTLIEALAWYEPQCLALFRELCGQGLIEIAGSAYGQNIMRFFSHEYNVRQLNEQLDLFQHHLGIDPKTIKTFWPPERVWDTALMAAILRDPALRNGGFDYTLVDDRLLLPVAGEHSPRHAYDQSPAWDAQLFQACKIRDGQGLIALPIAANLRRCIPPRIPQQQRNVEQQLRWLHTLVPAPCSADLIAIYADDMEKPAAIGWDAKGPAQFEQFLRWLTDQKWVTPVKVSDWAAAARIGESRTIEGGTYQELAVEFDAGELYENWYFDSRWNTYRTFFEWSEWRVRHLKLLGANARLIELAEKHLLASGWETAWHTPNGGAHGNINSDAGPGGSSKSVASHSRHAAVIAEAAYWQSHKDGDSHCYLFDIDNDGHEELILKNRELFAVVSPGSGGRLVAAFCVTGQEGMMVIGNPSDDWNFKEELNDYMDVPANHPGALADVGFEHDSYTCRIEIADGAGVLALLVNNHSESPACGLTKQIRLSSYESCTLDVDYLLPHNLSELDVEFGLSPDYLNLLRKGRSILMPHDTGDARGWRTDKIAVWVKPAPGTRFRWAKPHQAEFGHGCALRLCAQGPRFGISIGMERQEISATNSNSAGGEL